MEEEMQTAAGFWVPVAAPAFPAEQHLPLQDVDSQPWGPVGEKKLRRRCALFLILPLASLILLGNLWSLSSVCVIKAEGHSRGKSALMLRLSVFNALSTLAA